MTETGTLQIATPSEREIVMSRVFDAPRNLVFDAWTKPELLERWLGVRGGATKARPGECRAATRLISCFSLLAAVASPIAGPTVARGEPAVSQALSWSAVA